MNTHNSEQLAEEIIKTGHSILGAFGPGDKGMDIVHSDLFDSRRGVVLSAVNTLARCGNETSRGYLSRLLSHQDQEVRAAAAAALGELEGSGSKDVLVNVFKTDQSEKVRFEVLSTLARITGSDAEVVTLIRAYSESGMVAPQTRAAARALLVKVGTEQDLKNVVQEACKDPQVMEKVCGSLEEHTRASEILLKEAMNRWEELSLQQKSAVIEAGVASKAAGSDELLIKGLADEQEGLRRACYRLVGRGGCKPEVYEQIARILHEKIGPSPEAEEEARRAISGMEEAGIKLSSPEVKQNIGQKINDCYGKLHAKENRKVNDEHELGWLMARSREYMEFYGSEDLKHAVVGYLKGSGNYGMDDLIAWTRKTAVKVEVGHFAGYNALMNVIKNPNRAGKALIARELGLAKVGKNQLMRGLERCLYLSRLYQCDEWSATFSQIYCWARQKKLYRVAEAALYALCGAAPEEAAKECCKNLRVPPESKILAIASVRLMEEVGWGGMEQALRKMVKECSDRYVLLNLLEALCERSTELESELIDAVMDRLGREKDQELNWRLGSVLTKKADAGVVDELVKLYRRSAGEKKEVILWVIEEVVQRSGGHHDVGLSEFLYGVLREDQEEVRVRAALVLYSIGDDYAAKVVEDVVKNSGTGGKLKLLRGLKGRVKAEVAGVIGGLLMERNSELQEALREAVSEVADREAAQKLVEEVVRLRKMEGDEVDEGEEVYAAVGQNEGIDFERQKKSYRFEQEHIEECTVFFVDIVGYSKKSQELGSMELNSLIQEYEGILLSVTSAHGGQLIKRMGDGHLIVFENVLDGVLSGVRLQKAMKRFNSFREQRLRVVVRVGVHSGGVVRRGGDVYGEVVNLASRLEGAAKGGSVYVSQRVYEKVKGYVHVREVGEVELKGIEGLVKVYEPYEVGVDIPWELDPLKGVRKAEQGGSGSEVEQAGGRHTAGGAGRTQQEVNRRLVRYMKATLVKLNRLCVEAEEGRADIRDIRREVAVRWNRLEKAVKDLKKVS
ncbi:MAG: adenylate/guanylate cyclase domain-containing protein [Spirochaetota bacterium]